jgi:hypothetical protein
MFHQELQLPHRGKSLRVTRRPMAQPGETLVLFDEEGPGCIMHWWLTHARRNEEDARYPNHDLQLRFFATTMRRRRPSTCRWPASSVF